MPAHLGTDTRTRSHRSTKGHPLFVYEASPRADVLLDTPRERIATVLTNSATWQDLPDGRLWRLRIHTPGAASHNLGIAERRLLGDGEAHRARPRPGDGGRFCG